MPSTATLLTRGVNAKGRKELAYTLNIEESELLNWINHADLFHVRGVGSEYSDLFEAASVDTVPELRQRNAAALYETLFRRMKQAKSLPRVIEY